MDKYVFVHYDDAPEMSNNISIKYVSDDFDNANKMAFSSAKDRLYQQSLRTHKIVKDYGSQDASVDFNHVMVEYRIASVIDGSISYVDYEVWAVIKVKNETEVLEDIDNSLLIYEDVDPKDD